MKHNLIPANNLCKGIWDILLEWLDKYGVGKDCCLVSETAAVEKVFKERFPNTDFGFVSKYTKSNGSDYTVDFNIPFEPDKKYDSVYCQSLLEHVCRPSIAIENMARLCKPGGTIVISTHFPGFQIHRFPIDCVRFLKDFWVDLCKYLPIELLEYEQDKFHVYIAYRRDERDFC